MMEAGIDVMVEKPITATAGEARRLIELADQRGRIIQVGHVERYNPAIMAVAEIVRGARYIEAERLGVFVPRSLDVDVLLDLMIHDLNLVLSLQRQKVVEIRAVGVPVLTDKVDMTNVRLELENGAVANLTASRVSQDRIRKQRFFCGDCYISVDTKEQEVKGVRLVERTASAPSVRSSWRSRKRSRCAPRTTPSCSACATGHVPSCRVKTDSKRWSWPRVSVRPSTPECGDSEHDGHQHRHHWRLGCLRDGRADHRRRADAGNSVRRTVRSVRDRRDRRHGRGVPGPPRTRSSVHTQRGELSRQHLRLQDPRVHTICLPPRSAR